MTAPTFGSVIRRQRETLGKTLRVLAKDARISSAYLSRIERDEESPPSERVIARIAQALSFEFDELCRLAGRIPSDIAEHVLTNRDVMRRLRRQTDKALAK